MQEHLVQLSPVTASTRGTIFHRPDVDKVKPFKKLLCGRKKQSAGRNNTGRITSRHRGGGHKRLLRSINFQKSPSLFDIPAQVLTIEYDPNRTANIALIKYNNGVHEYMVAPDGLKRGAFVVTSVEADIVIGNTLPLSNIPIGTMVHCVESKPGAGAVFGRSAGNSIVLVGKGSGLAIISLPSGETRKINATCLATIGSVSNALKQNQKIGKAGRNRWKGVRPQTRGVAMNPVDHPHGGGEGKTSGGRDPVSPWGQKAKGLKTRKNKRTDRFIVTRRKK